MVLAAARTTKCLSPPTSPLPARVVLVDVVGTAMLVTRPVAGNVVTLAASLISAGFEVEYGHIEVLLRVLGTLDAFRSVPCFPARRR